MSSSEDRSSQPSLPSETIGGSRQGDQQRCILAKPGVEVVWGSGPTAVSGIRVALAELTGDRTATCTFDATDVSGRAPWRTGAGVPAGRYRVTLTGLDENLYEQTTAEVSLDESFEGRKQILLKKLGRPSLLVGWGASLATKSGGVKVRLTKTLVNTDYGPTSVTGTANLSATKGLDPGQYTVSLPEADDRKFYVLETATVTVDEGHPSDRPIQILLKKLARPKIRLLDADGKGVAGIPVKLVTGAPPAVSPPPTEYSFGESRRSGTAEMAASATGIPHGQFTIVLGVGTYEPTLTTPAAVTLAEGTTETIVARVTMAKGVLVVELTRHDGQSVRPIGSAANVVVAINLASAVAADHNFVEQTPTVVKEAGRSVTVRKAVVELKALDRGTYEIELKDVVRLLAAQDPPSSPPSTRRWRVGPSANGKVSVAVVPGKTTKAAFGMTCYEQAQFIAFNVTPGTKDGYICSTCNSLSFSSGNCSTALHGPRHGYTCGQCVPATTSALAGDCGGNHPVPFRHYCRTCDNYFREDGPHTGCLGTTRPRCKKCTQYVVRSNCATCGMGVVTRKTHPWGTGRCPHNVPYVALLPATKDCPVCHAAFTRQQVYLGLADAEDDLGARCFIMTEQIKKAFGGANASDKILKVFMAPEFFFRNREGGYPVELISSILEIMRDETSKTKYADWLFVYGSAIGFLPHETAVPSSSPVESEYPLQITQVVPGAPTRLHVVGRSWAGTDLCERIPEKNATLDDLCKWKIKQGSTAAVAVAGRKRVARVAVDVRVTTAGVLGTMVLDWKIASESTWTSVTSTADNAFTFEVPGNRCALLFEPGVYVLASTYSIAADGVVTRGGSAIDTVKTRDRGAMTAAIEVEITTAGALGTMAFKWRLAGSGPYSTPVIATTGNPFVLAIPGAGHRVSFAAGTYVLSSTYTIAESGAVTVGGSGITTVTTAQFCGTGCPRATTASAVEYEIEVAGGTWTAGDCALVEPKATEIFNVALVQKGGSDAGVSSLRELLVYKEFISPIDFVGPYYSKDEFHGRTGAGRLAFINDVKRRLLPVSGSRDLLATKPNPLAGERTESGLGGGAVFTVDGIGFGLEVCLDHLENRLWEYYESSPPAGTAKVQIHLIPSWGMSIGNGNRCGVQNALIFNVDGPDGSAVGKLTDPAATDPNDNNEGEWDPVNASTSVALEALPTADWTIKMVNPLSRNRDEASPPPSPPGPFALITKTLTTDLMGTFFESKTTGTAITDYGDILVYDPQDIPPAETV